MEQNAEKINNRELFESMPVYRALGRLAMPTVISQLILLIYNLSDTYFIGRTQDPYMVAGASLIYPVYNICIALANIFGTGGGSLISRLLGSGRTKEAGKVCSFCFYGSIACSVIFSLIVYFNMDRLLVLLGASSNTIRYARQYTFYVIVLGALPSVLTIAMSNIMRSTGKSGLAAFGTSMGCVLNVVLDPIFMFVIMPKGHEIIGAASATMLSNCVSAVYFIICFMAMSKKSVLTLDPSCGLPGKNDIAAVFGVGIPSGLTMFLFDVTNIVIDRLSSAHGDIAVAAIGIVLKAERIPLNTGVGICLGMMPLIGYNYASGSRERMKKVLRCSRIWGISFALICTVLYEIFAGDVMSVFINDSATIAAGSHFLRARCLASPVMFMCFNYVFFFEAVGKGKISLFLAVIRQLAFNIPMLLIFDHFFGMDGIILTQLIADFCTAAVSFAIYRKEAGNDFA
ncbi:MAG: MATE family efflux transporter [Anaerovoracaceae bacterium]